MTTREFQARIAAAAARATGPAEAPTGRSYHVTAASRDLAPNAARILAHREGHRNAARARVLHIERVDDAGTYEVVLAE